MSTAPKILALQEIQDPPKELCEALTPDFLRPLRIESLPPVRIARRPPGATWGGFCQGKEYAEYGEVVLNDPTAQRESWLITEQFQEIYLHEITHRLLAGHKEDEIGGIHGAVFFALQLLLFLRLPARSTDRPWILRAGVYDLQDAWLAKDYTPGQALDWASTVADLLHEKEISAETASVEIVQKFAAWRQVMAEAPAKRRAAQIKAQCREKELVRVKNKLLGTRIYLAAASFFFFLILFLVR